MKPGELFVLDCGGQVREVINGYGIDGPWDATALDLGSSADLFVSNVLNGIVNGQPMTTTKGNVVRLNLNLTGAVPKVIASTVIANGISVHTDPAALIVGPTGVALSPNGTLFVADTASNRIAGIPNAVFRHTPVNAGAAAATVFANKPNANGPSTARWGSSSRRMVTCWPPTAVTTTSSSSPRAASSSRSRTSTPPTRPRAGRCSAWPRPRTRTGSTSSTTTPIR